MNIKLLILLSFLTPSLLFSSTLDYEIGDELESKRSSDIALFHFKTDAIKLQIARDHTFSLNDFILHGSVDSRDIYKPRKGEVIRIEESIRKGDIFRVELLNPKRVKRTKFYVFKKDLKYFSHLAIEEL